jgi:hypothetical protein
MRRGHYPNPEGAPARAARPVIVCVHYPNPEGARPERRAA